MAHIIAEKSQIVDFCRKHHIRKLSLFGSVLRDDFRPDSDIDVLVEFEPGHVPGLAFFTMEAELSEILGRKVDLNTPQFLSRYFRDQVKAGAEVQFTSETGEPERLASSKVAAQKLDRLRQSLSPIGVRVRALIVDGRRR